MENVKNKTVSNWSTSDMRFVAYLDILGFKDMVMRNPHSVIYDLLSKISKQRESLDNVQSKDFFSEKFQDAGIYSVSFSDSIMLFSKKDTPEDLKFFIFSVLWIFTKALESSVPIKGAIAHGQISINKSQQIYFGQPIIDAYLLEEELKYMGIVAHNTIDKYINDKSVYSVSN